jgi:DNA-binding XRE family transcriptional regulator
MASHPHPLAQARADKRLSREALAALAGISPRTIYAIEVEGVRPQRATVRVLSLALRCEPKEMGLACAADIVP